MITIPLDIVKIYLGTQSEVPGSSELKVTDLGCGPRAYPFPFWKKMGKMWVLRSLETSALFPYEFELIYFHPLRLIAN